jgi:hypothetical protein
MVAFYYLDDSGQPVGQGAKTDVKRVAPAKTVTDLKRL